MPTSTQVRGQNGVFRALQDTPKEARAVLRDVIRDRTRLLTQRTKQAAPFETGATREAIVAAPPKGTSLTGSVQMASGTFRGRVPSSYLFVLEYSTHPFVRATAEREAAGFVAAVRAAGKTIERNLENRGGRFL